MNEFNFQILAVDFPKEERERIIKEHKEKMKWAQSLTKEEINFLCDAGFYNDAIKGYLITAARNAHKIALNFFIPFYLSKARRLQRKPQRR